MCYALHTGLVLLRCHVFIFSVLFLCYQHLQLLVNKDFQFAHDVDIKNYSSRLIMRYSTNKTSKPEATKFFMVIGQTYMYFSSIT